MLQGKRKKKDSLSNTNTILPPSPSPDLVIPPPQAGHTVEHHSFNTDDNVNREKEKISEGKHSQLELDRQDVKSKNPELMQMQDISVSDAPAGFDNQPYCSFPAKYQTQSYLRTPDIEETNVRNSSHIKEKDLGELPYGGTSSFQGQLRSPGGYQNTFDLKKEITEDIRYMAQSEQPSVMHAPSTGVIKGLRTSVIQHTQSLPKRQNSYKDRKLINCIKI